MLVNPSIDNDWGVYRAVVVNNQDNFQLGRVQVRIPCFHGNNKDGIPDKDLPWATLCMMGASYQSGTFIVPEKNSTVFVIFENGNHSSPVVLGGVYSRGTQNVRYLNQSPKAYTEKGPQPIEDSLYFEKVETERVVPAFQHDVIEEARVDTATKVLYKSPKGAQVLIKDVDGGEYLELRDANNQFLSFLSPLDPYKSKDNKHKYNPPEENLLYRARTILTNSLGHVISFFSDGKNGDMDIMDKLNKMGVEIDGTEGYLRIIHQKGSKVEIKLTEGSVSLKTEKATISLDDDNITLKAKSIKIEGEDVQVNGSSLGLAGSIDVNGPLVSNSSVRGNLVDSNVHASAPRFRGVTNSLKDWQEEV